MNKGEIRNVNKRTCSCDVAQVMRYRGMVDNSVSDHLVGAQFQDQTESKSVMSVLACEEQMDDDNTILVDMGWMLREPDSKLQLLMRKIAVKPEHVSEGVMDLGMRPNSATVIFLTLHKGVHETFKGLARTNG